MLQVEWHAGSSFWVGSKVLCGISTAFVLTRLYARAVFIRSVGVDDYLLLLGMCASIAGCSVIWKSFDYGLGSHIDTVPPQDLVMVLKLMFVEYHLYLIAAHSIRASLVALYMRLNPSRVFRVICWIYFAVNIIVYIIFTFLVIFMCNPVAFYWDKMIPGGTCLDAALISATNGWFLIALDLGALILPVVMVWQMQAPKRQKIALLAVFALGFFVCIASFNRLHTFTGSPDLTYELAEPHAWSLLEINCALIAASFPGINKLLQRIFPQKLKSIFSSSGSSTEDKCELAVVSNSSSSVKHPAEVTVLPTESREELIDPDAPAHVQVPRGAV